MFTLGLLLAGPSRADITWDWRFGGSEIGTFTTNGNLVAGVAPAGTYNLVDFSVVASAAAPLGSLLGADYIVIDPGQGFVWDGSKATQFFGQAGVLNGRSFLGSNPDPPAWIVEFRPAAVFPETLVSNSTGIVASGDINCHFSRS